MLNIEGKNVGSMMTGGKLMSMLVTTGKVIWQAIRSCFGTGIWKSDKPWIGDDNWKNNK